MDFGDLELIGVVWHKNRAVRVLGAGFQKQGKSGERQQGFGRRGTIASPVCLCGISYGVIKIGHSICRGKLQKHEERKSLSKKRAPYSGRQDAMKCRHYFKFRRETIKDQGNGRVGRN